MNKGLKIFITYAHKNSEAKDELIISLAVLKQNGLIDAWHDNEMLPGDKWQDEIFNNLADSDILLYLTCRYSLASENCNKELTAALDPNIRVIPIILEQCDWKNHQLSKFQALPDGFKPINEWQPESKGWQNVVEGIRKVVTEIQAQAKPSPRITPEEMETLSNVKLQQGNFLMMLEQMDLAIAAYSRAIEFNPEFADAYNGRGAAYGTKGEFDRATADWNKAIELNPKLAQAYSNRGIAHREKGEFDRALADWNKAIELNPKLAEAYVNRGSAYGAKGEIDLAIKDLEKSIELDPHLAEAYSNLGAAYIEKGKVNEAINACNIAFQLQPNHVRAYVNRGNAYGTKGEFDRALADYNKAIELNPKLAEAYYNRGIMWLGLQEWGNFRSDWSDARDVGIDITIGFRNVYGSVANFERRIGIQLPPDIAAMLTHNS